MLTTPIQQQSMDSTAGTATTNVLEIYELLQSILRYLPIFDILIVIRICKSWMKVIKTSPEIQKFLFLKPRGQLAVPFKKQTMEDAYIPCCYDTQ